MAIQFLRGETNAIATSDKTLKKGQPLLNTDTGCLYISSNEGAVKDVNKFKYPAFSGDSAGLVKYSENCFSVDSNSYVTAEIKEDYLCIYTNSGTSASSN